MDKKGPEKAATTGNSSMFTTIRYILHESFRKEIDAGKMEPWWTWDEQASQNQLQIGRSS